MTSKRKRMIEKVLKELAFEPAPLSTKKGRLIRNDHCPNKVNSKTRRHKGWVTPRLAGKGNYKEIFKEGVEPQIFYDEWQSVKDGIHFDPDETHIRSEFMSGGSKCRNCGPYCRSYEYCTSKDRPVIETNKKLIKQIEIRKAKKEKLKFKMYSTK